MTPDRNEPPPHDDRRLLWVGADVYAELVAAAAGQDVTVDALVEELLAGVAGEVE